MPVCSLHMLGGGWGGVQGTGSGHSGTPLFFCCGLWSSCRPVRGVVCARCSGPHQQGVGALPQGLWVG